VLVTYSDQDRWQACFDQANLPFDQVTLLQFIDSSYYAFHAKVVPVTLEILCAVLGPAPGGSGTEGLGLEYIMGS